MLSLELFYFPFLINLLVLELSISSTVENNANEYVKEFFLKENFIADGVRVVFLTVERIKEIGFEVFN